MAGEVNHVHLVGSIGLDSVQEIMRTVGSTLGRRLERIPDGEVGPRRLWVSFQYPLLRSSPFLRPDPGGAVRATSKFPKLTLVDGVTEDEISFGELGYAREARASYQDFLAARARGEIPQATRFQVCLPCPMGVIYAFCMEDCVEIVDRCYEKAMIAEAQAVCAAIPHADLSIQWDFCHEMILLDGQSQDWFPLVNADMDAIMARMARLAAAIPPAVEMGVHLCYGDFGASHFIQPRDAGRMVEVANAMTAAIGRRIDFLHFPVPTLRNDEAYFAPFAKLKLNPATKVFLGVIHLSEGRQGVDAKLAQARRFTRVDAISTECGIARARKPEMIRQILDLHARAVTEPAA